MKLFQKSLAAALALAMMAGTAACDLVGVDKEKDLQQVIAVVNGEEIYKDEYQKRMDRVTLQYQAYGMDITGDAESYAMLQEQVYEGLIDEVIFLQKANELDLALTAEEQEEFENDFKSMMDESAENFRTQATEELGTQATEEEIYARMYEMLEEDLAAYFWTMDEYKQALLNEELQMKLQEYVTDPIEFSEEEAKEWYDAEVEEQKATYADTPAAFESAMNVGQVSETAVYAPEGYFYVKHVLIAYSDEQKADISAKQLEIDDLGSQIGALIADDEQGNAAQLAELRTKLDTLKAEKDDITKEYTAKAQEVLDKIAAGEDFDALIDEYGDDPGMNQEPYKSMGYLVGAESTWCYASFRDGAVALNAVGDTSGMVETNDGIHILKKVSEVTPGAIPFDEVKDICMESGLGEKCAEALTAAMEEWSAAAAVERHEDRLVDNSDNYVE